MPWVLHRDGCTSSPTAPNGSAHIRFPDVRHAAIMSMIEEGIDKTRVMEIVGQDPRDATPLCDQARIATSR